MPQVRNAETVEVLAADFQLRYEPNFARGNAIALTMGMPGLVGLWPMAASQAAGDAVDVSGNGLTLVRVGADSYSRESLRPRLPLTGASYLVRSTETTLNITGTEAHIEVSKRGLTLGGWFKPDAFRAANQHLIAKWGGAPQLSYTLFLASIAGSNLVSLGISVDGTAIKIGVGTAYIPAVWNCLVARFVPSSSIDVWVNGAKTTDVAAIPASIFVGETPFCIGSNNAVAGDFYFGNLGMCFLSKFSATDTEVFNFYQQTKALYGV